MKQYIIYDRKDNKIVSKPYKTRQKARHRADKLDLDYGAYRYQVRDYEKTDIRRNYLLSCYCDGELKIFLSPNVKIKKDKERFMKATLHVYGRGVHLLARDKRVRPESR